MLQFFIRHKTTLEDEDDRYTITRISEKSKYGISKDLALFDYHTKQIDLSAAKGHEGETVEVCHYTTDENNKVEILYRSHLVLKEIDTESDNPHLQSVTFTGTTTFSNNKE